MAHSLHLHILAKHGGVLTRDENRPVLMKRNNTLITYYIKLQLPFFGNKLTSSYKYNHVYKCGRLMLNIIWEERGHC